MEREDVVVAATGVLEGAAVRLAVLFGSFARGTPRQDSDVDIGFLPLDRELPLSDELTLQASLSRALGREVDLVRLDRASTFLRWQIARDGVLLHAETPGSWPRFRATAASEFADFRPAMEQAARRFRARLLAPPTVSSP